MRCVILFVISYLMTQSTVSVAVDTRFMQGISNTYYHELSSEIIGRSYHIYVMQPAGQEQSNEENYPTVYILDGGALFPLLTVYYRYLVLAEEIPEAIIVAISYGSDNFEGGNYRSTDYTAKSSEREYWGGAERFQSFMSDELFPFIEQNYRSRSDRRIIFGQSLGGQFVLYTALMDLDLFWGHIASNPALHRNLPFFLKRHNEAVAERTSSKLFVSSGSMDEPRFRKPALKWIEHWSAIDTLPWQLKTINLDGHSHMSAPPAAFRQGMRWLFSSD